MGKNIIQNFLCLLQDRQNKHRPKAKALCSSQKNACLASGTCRICSQLFKVTSFLFVVAVSVLFNKESAVPLRILQKVLKASAKPSGPKAKNLNLLLFDGPQSQGATMAPGPLVASYFFTGHTGGGGNQTQSSQDLCIRSI